MDETGVFGIELGDRLKTVAEMVSKCDVLCDVGTDHGLIPIYLMDKNIISRAIASDINEGPLKAAQRNIFQRNYGDRIELRLGNGLKVIEEGECDCAVIAGMGGYLIREIIADSFRVASGLKQLVLQPMNGHEVLREYLYSNGFDIVGEKLARERDKFYIVLSVRYTGIEKKLKDRIYLYIGERLVASKDPLLTDYIDKHIKSCSKILDSLNNSDGNKEAREKYSWLKSGYESILKNITGGD